MVLTLATILCYYTAAPVISSLVIGVPYSQVLVVCISTGSPAMTVVWAKDGTNLNTDSSYQLSQVLINRRASTYNNTLILVGDPHSFQGNYSCTVSNRFGSASESVWIGG